MYKMGQRSKSVYLSVSNDHIFVWHIIQDTVTVLMKPLFKLKNLTPLRIQFFANLISESKFEYNFRMRSILKV